MGSPGFAYAGVTDCAVLVTCEEVDGFFDFAFAIFLRQALAAIDVADDVLLTGALEGAPRRFHLGDKFFAVLGVRFFKEVSESANLTFRAVEAVDDVLL